MPALLVCIMRYQHNDIKNNSNPGCDAIRMLNLNSLPCQCLAIILFGRT